MRIRGSRTRLAGRLESTPHRVQSPSGACCSIFTGTNRLLESADHLRRSRFVASDAYVALPRLSAVYVGDTSATLRRFVGAMPPTPDALGHRQSHTQCSPTITRIPYRVSRGATEATKATKTPNILVAKIRSALLRKR
jgi:hypothetical protein